MRKLIIGLLAMSFIAMPAFAQLEAPTVGPETGAQYAGSVRVWSMGLEPNDTPDIGNILTYPQLITQYQNRLWLVDHSFETISYSLMTLDSGAFPDPEELTISGMAGQSEPNEILTGGILLCALKDYTVGVGLTTPASGALTGRIGSQYSALSLSVGGIYPHGAVIDPDNKVDLFFAGALGNGVVGAVLSYATGSAKGETESKQIDPAPVVTDVLPNLESSSSGLGLRLGYTMEEIGPLASLDVAFGMEIPGFEAIYSDPFASDAVNPGAEDKAVCEKDGGSDMAVDVLGVKELDDDTNVRIMLGYAKSGLDTAQTEQIDGDDDGAYTTPNEVTDTNVKTLYSESGSSIGARLALNKTVNDDELLVIALGLVRESQTIEESHEIYQDSTAVASRAATWEKQNTVTNDKVERSRLSVPMAVGVEGNVLRDNITARLGARKVLLQTESETSTDDTYGSMTDNSWGITSTSTAETSSKVDSDVTLGLGVGVELGNFTVDGYMEQDILFNGPYWVTGNASSFISKLDVTYAWE